MKLTVNCDWCGKPFERKKGQLHNHNYCSKACLGKANGERFRLARLRVCDNCGKQYEYTGNHKNRNSHFFCCYECFSQFREKKVLVTCEWCGKSFRKKRSDLARTKHSFCCNDCRLQYVRSLNADNPNKRIEGRLVYHRLAEQKYGRPLKEGEQVHHIDGNHANNAIDNLEVLTASEHSKLHASKKERDRFGKFAKRAEYA